MFNLKKDEIHIRNCVFEEHYNNLDFFYEILDEKEKERANRFYFKKDQDNFKISRGLLKYFISKYTNTNYEKIIFSYNNFGKPFLENSNLKFNISHTKDIALFAFCNDLEIGIDIEKIREVKNYKDIVKRFFSKNEIKEFFELPENEYQTAFFTIWSRKEAFIKAVGQGLSLGLDSFDVSVLEDLPEIKNVRIDNQKKESWKMFNLAEIKDNKCSLVIENDILSGRINSDFIFSYFDYYQ